MWYFSNICIVFTFTIFPHIHWWLNNHNSHLKNNRETRFFLSLTPNPASEVWKLHVYIDLTLIAQNAFCSSSRDHVCCIITVTYTSARTTVCFHFHVQHSLHWSVLLCSNELSTNIYFYEICILYAFKFWLKPRKHYN